MAERAKDFDMSAPPKAVTDPQGAVTPRNPHYPRHLARFVDLASNEREIRIVQSEADEAEARADGWLNHHELDRVRAAEKADKAVKKTPGKQASGPARTSD